MKTLMKLNLRYVLTGILLALLLVWAVFFLKKIRPVPITPPTIPQGVAVYQAIPKIEGPDAAPVKIIEYSDFECPSCRVAQDTLRQLFKKYPEKLQVTFRHFPLSSHKWSIYAHQAAECMNIQGKFWPYHDKVYAEQQKWAPSKVPPVDFFVQSAQQLGGQMDLFMNCMADVAVTREIYAEKEQGAKQQVNATPTFFIGQERFVGPKELEGRGENAIRRALGLSEKPIVEEKKEKNLPR